MKWLCRLGLHKWYSDSRYAFWDPPVPAYCDRCGKTRGGFGLPLTMPDPDPAASNARLAMIAEAGDHAKEYVREVEKRCSASADEGQK